MACITQGSPLANIKTTQTTATAAPSFYTCYLKNLSTQGANAASNAKYVCATPLQQQAFTNTASNVGNYQPALNQACAQINAAAKINASNAGSGALNQALGQCASGASSGYLSSAANANVVGSAQPYLSQAISTNPLNAAQKCLSSAANTNVLAAAQKCLSSAANTNVLAAAQPYMNQASQGTCQTYKSYMSPYIKCVVNSIGTLGQQNIAMNLAPQTTAGIVGAGQFGSTRGANALGQTIMGAENQLTAQQACALQKGFNTALCAAQKQAALYSCLSRQAGTFTQNQAANQLAAGQAQGQFTQNQAANQLAAGQAQGQFTQNQAANLLNAGATTGQLTQNQAQNQLNAGQTTGNLINTQMANQANIGQIQGNLASATAQNLLNSGVASQNLAMNTQTAGINCANALANMGAQCQTIKQNAQLFPLQQITNESALLRGYTIPTSTSSTYCGPIPGAYSASPLQQAAGIAALGAGVLGTKIGACTIGNAIGKYLGGSGSSSNSNAGNANGTNITNGTTGTGDTGSNSPTLPDGSPNPNYDAYADPNATQAAIDAQNAANGSTS